MVYEQPCDRIESRLISIGQRIGAEDLAGLSHPSQVKIPEWTGADVRVTSDFSDEPNNLFDAHDLLIRTRNAGTLTWLFFEIRDAFADLLNFSNKYGFYGSLAQCASQHLAANQPEPVDPRPLLRSVLARAFEWLQIFRDTGEIPANAVFIFHTQDAGGRQRRIDLETGEDTH